VEIPVSHRHTKLRGDLVVSRQGTAQETTFVVKDPATGRFFRLKEPEYFIGKQLDGATPVDVIRQRVEERYGAPLSAEGLEQFIEKLRRLGLLESEGTAVGQRVHEGGRIRGSLLYLRLKAFDPDRLLDRLISKVRFFFTPSFIVVSAALILLALVITISNSAEPTVSPASALAARSTRWALCFSSSCPPCTAT
jgi:putative peptide zinc metalloprotease protein